MDKLIGIMEETGLSFAYDHFAEGESPDPPFLIFLYPSSDNFAADGEVYYHIDNVNVELYTDRKDPEKEKLVEAVLKQHGIFYQKTETWIESEALYEVLYQFEMEGIGNEQEE